MLSPEGRKQWSLLSDDNRKVLLTSGTTTTSSLMTDSTTGTGRDFHRQERGQPQNKWLKVAFSDCGSDTDMAPTDTASSGSSGYISPTDVDIIDHICKAYNLDMDTLHAHVAKWWTEDNKAMHKHWKPPKGSGLPASDVCRMMAAKADIDVNGIKYSIKKALTLGQPTNVSIDGVTYSVSMALSTYHVSASRRSASGSLIDKGANGGIVGDDCRLIEETTRFVNIEGIDDHMMEHRPTVMASATVKSNRGPVILIMNQYAHAGKGHTIHSSPQMKYYGLSVDEKSRKVGSLQQITTNDGFVFTINIRRGLPYLDMRPFTDEEWDDYA